jgi:type IV pilus assembly protein PilA
MKTARAKFQKGFTLIELLVVIGILAVLLAITLIAINPARQFEQANNTQRASDVNAILNGIWQFAVDNNGDLSGLAIPATATNIGSDTGGGDVDLCPQIAPQYIAQLPVDPQTGTWTDCTDYDTQYEVLQTAAGRVTVSAPDAEGGALIEVTR